MQPGAPIDAIQLEGETALDLLHSMQVEEGSKDDRERRGLISVLEKQYWQGYKKRNPFLHTVVSAEETVILLLQGAAIDSTGHVDQTRVRSIRPPLRMQVLDMLRQRGGMKDTFVHILATMKRKGSISPFIALCGYESSILPIIVAFAGATGWRRQNLNEAMEVLQHVIDHFEYDVRDDIDGEDDDDTDDDTDDEEDY